MSAGGVSNNDQTNSADGILRRRVLEREGTCLSLFFLFADDTENAGLAGLGVKALATEATSRMRRAELSRHRDLMVLLLLLIEVRWLAVSACALGLHHAVATENEFSWRRRHAVFCSLGDVGH